jgi:hypothetical protein
LLYDLTGTDVVLTSAPLGAIIGLKMDAPITKKIIEAFYEMVKLGYPFLSCLPEEFVLAAILNKPEYSPLPIYPYSFYLFNGAPPGEPDSDEWISYLKENHYFFFLRKH